MYAIDVHACPISDRSVLRILRLDNIVARAAA